MGKGRSEATEGSLKWAAPNDVVWAASVLMMEGGVHELNVPVYTAGKRSRARSDVDIVGGKLANVDGGRTGFACNEGWWGIAFVRLATLLFLITKMAAQRHDKSCNRVTVGHARQTRRDGPSLVKRIKKAAETHALLASMDLWNYMHLIAVAAREGPTRRQ